jgi:hypothetical protein
MGSRNLQSQGIGAKLWVIPEGYIPESPPGTSREMISHETACILNPNEGDANLTITIFYSDRDPVGPYKLTVPAQRTIHLRFNDLNDPEPIPRETDYASIIESSIPIVVQHTRLDSRQTEKALMSTIVYSQIET